MQRVDSERFGGLATAELVAEARKLTGKRARPQDAQLVEYLESQEVQSASDFLGLSDESFESVVQHEAATLLIADALRKLRGQRGGEQGDKRGGGNASGSKRARVAEELPGSPVRRSPLSKVTINEFIGTITMMHNRKRNALGARLCAEIEAGIDKCAAAGVRVVILRAMPGCSVWSAGHDMREFDRSNGSSAQGGSGSFNDPLSRNDPFVQLLHKIRACAVPVIAAVEGGVWGGACDIVACCDLVVGTPTCSFAITPAKVGLPYHASGASHFLGILPLHVVKWMFFSSEPLSAESAARHGFINFCVPPEQLTEKAIEMASTIASRAPLVVQLLKKQLTTLSQSAALSPELFEELHELRKGAWLSDDMQEGVSAFFEKRAPKFTGH